MEASALGHHQLVKVTWFVAALLVAPVVRAADGGTVVCPTSVPIDGGVCTGTGTCEYGGDVHGLCSTFATCGFGGTWTVAPPSADCETSGPDCPKSFAALDSGVLCPLADRQQRCLYPEGICACPLPCTGANATLEYEWVCRPWTEAQAGCPSIRPTLGSACSQDGQECLWDGCCYDIPLGPDELCTDGGWTLHSINACSCPPAQACTFAPVPVDAGPKDASVDASPGAEPETLVSGCTCDVSRPTNTPAPFGLLVALLAARRKFSGGARGRSPRLVSSAQARDH